MDEWQSTLLLWFHVPVWLGLRQAREMEMEYGMQLQKFMVCQHARGQFVGLQDTAASPLSASSTIELQANCSKILTNRIGFVAFVRPRAWADTPQLLVSSPANL
ncbi:uncharacterized protein F5Z01DRAFT_636672 [Emericellopsis atlantica]|uniref:Secreted protein n=1 Tax=Emericellopsis atlantica TaxID=2614577 RepID=A0A9P8CPB3_9HYPO|nr:uncharacterized protein F5Z01DRAFT_636672 [Emericellopsis atlantica]KAG9254007.1 hypothetical protein F5Z01DRAFT_636672 [Emericellopsis atlantica]